MCRKYEHLTSGELAESIVEAAESLRHHERQRDYGEGDVPDGVMRRWIDLRDELGNRMEERRP